MMHAPTTVGAPGRRRALPRAMRALEAQDRVDGVVRALAPVAERVVAAPARRAVLLGDVLGHAVHPLLTDVPVGAWTSATVLDLTAGPAGRDAARRLVGVGVLSAVPTAITGFAEWAVADLPSRRVGVVHAGANGVALLLNVVSWWVRRRGGHRSGAALTVVAGAAVAVGGQLGGHLTLVRHLGSRQG